MPIWRIGKVATSSVTVEEADTWEQACRKAGWEPEDCEAADITESVQVLTEGDLHRARGEWHPVGEGWARELPAVRQEGKGGPQDGRRAIAD